MENPPQTPSIGSLVYAASKKAVKPAIYMAIPVVLAALGFGGYSLLNKAPSAEFNQAGQPQTACITVLSGKEASFNKGYILNSKADFKDPNNVKVFISNKALLPNGLNSVMGKKVHIFVKLTKHETYGNEYVINGPDDFKIE